MLHGFPAEPRRAPRPAVERRGSGLGANLLVLTGVIVLLLALPLNHVRRTADPDRLSAHAAEVLADPEARAALVKEATNRITARTTDDAGLPSRTVRSAVEPRIERLVASERFATAWEESVRRSAARLLDPDVPYVAVTVDDVAGLTAAVTQPFPAPIAQALERTGPIDIVSFDRTTEQQRGLETLEWLRGLALPLLLVGVVALLLALAVSRNRRRTVIAIGGALVVLALLLLGLQSAIRAATLDVADPGQARDVTAVVWDQLMGGFRTQNIIILISGLLMIGAAAAFGRGSSSRAGRARP